MRRAGFALLLTVSALLSGCYLPPPGAVSGRVVVREGPPPLREEIIAERPGPNFVWVRGHWVWRDRWVWAPGHWRARPYRGAYWVRGRWDRRDDGMWIWYRGHWR